MLTYTVSRQSIQPTTLFTHDTPYTLSILYLLICETHTLCSLQSFSEDVINSLYVIGVFVYKIKYMCTTSPLFGTLLAAPLLHTYAITVTCFPRSLYNIHLLFRIFNHTHKPNYTLSTILGYMYTLFLSHILNNLNHTYI